jgi:multidrug efflux pump subunit AcrA (membrane-fusion protein)
VISYVSPIIDEKTRTTVVRVEMSNTEGLFRPGMYVKAYVFADNIKANLVILQSALQVVENRLSVFIRDGDSFRPAQDLHVYPLLHVLHAAPAQKHKKHSATTSSLSKPYDS